ncbi:hypothetical protein AVEN_7311-1, partial [Araneus ventricosus]
MSIPSLISDNSGVPRRSCGEISSPRKYVGLQLWSNACMQRTVTFKAQALKNALN